VGHTAHAANAGQSNLARIQSMHSRQHGALIREFVRQVTYLLLPIRQEQNKFESKNG
jgi:hypothetical protein